MTSTENRQLSQEIGPDPAAPILGKRQAEDRPTESRKKAADGLHFKKFSDAARAGTRSPAGGAFAGGRDASAPQENERDGPTADQMDEGEDGVAGATAEVASTGDHDEPDKDAIIEEPGREWTPTPRGGFPEIVGHTAESVLQGMGLRHCKDIQECEDKNKFFVYTYPPISDARPTTVERITLAVNDMAPVKGTVLEVAPPVLAKGKTYEDYDKFFLPTMYLVTGALDVQRKRILDKKVWPSAEITLIAIPVEPEIDDFMFVLSGYTLPATDAAEEKVRSTVTKAIFECKEAGPFLINLYADEFGGDPDHNPEDRRAATEWATGIVSSVYVRSEVVDAADTKQVNWRVYGTPPTQHIGTHQHWMKIVCKLDYIIALKGRPKVFRFDAPDTKCQSCLSIDHRTGRCSQPLVQGWLGPDKQTRYVEPEKEAEVQVKLERPDKEGRGKARDEKRKDDNSREEHKDREGTRKWDGNKGNRKGKGKPYSR
ncbi:hypothetical protein HDZ31DRAFT_76016 [Schizophyllum fasciatum]